MFQWWLWASADLGKSFARYSRQSSSSTNNWILVALFFAILVLWVALAYWDKWRKRHFRGGNNPKSLFQELCRAHELSRPEQSLLRKAAETKRLGQPAMLFLDATILGDLAGTKSAEAGGYRYLSKKLFGKVGSG